MDALTFLKQQHEEVAELFEEIEDSDDVEERRAIFEEIADDLAIHATIEEKFFYPVVRSRQTAEEVEESYDEHLEVKKLLLDCMQSMDAPDFDSKLTRLMENVLHHVEEEENELFPEVGKLFEKEALEALGQRLEAEAADLEEQGDARLQVRPAIEEPALQP